MHKISKTWLSYIFVVLCLAPTNVNAMSKSEIKKDTLLVFGTAVVVSALEISFLKTLDRNSDFLTTIKSPELWLGSIGVAGVMSGLFYAFMTHDHIGAWFEKINSSYDRIKSYPIYNNRYASDEIFCESVLKYGDAIILQQMQKTRLRRSLQSQQMLSGNIFITLLNLGLAACALYHNIDDPRSDLLLLHVTDTLVENRKIVIQASNELTRLMEYLDKDKDDELIGKCHVLMNELKTMILEIERCIARIVGTKQWFNLVSNAQIVLNGTTGTKTIPNKFISSICESIGYFDAYHGHRSNVRKVREPEGMYIRFELDETMLQDWSAYAV